MADLAFLDRLIAAFPYREQMLPYLRRYYDLAVEAVAASDPERAAGYVLASRDERTCVRGHPAAVPFHVPAAGW